MQCPIWKTACEDLGGTDEYFFVNSPRAGGVYKLYGSAQTQVTEASIEQKVLLTSWLVQQHHAGISAPEIRAEVMDQLSTIRLMSFSRRVDAAIVYIAKVTGIAGMFFIHAAPGHPTVNSFLAETECRDADEGDRLTRLICEMGLLNTNEWISFHVSPAGWLRVEELQSKLIDSAQAFVAMWFNEITDEPYQNGLYRAIFDSGFDPRRVDQQHHHLNKVDDEIISEIRRSRFLVADFTCEPKQVRGGVYFETGFAMGLNIPIIWTCKDTSLADLHFDTRQYPHIVWKESHDLYKQLRSRIGALIGPGPKTRPR